MVFNSVRREIAMPGSLRSRCARVVGGRRQTPRAQQTTRFAAMAAGVLSSFIGSRSAREERAAATSARRRETH
jgi:hypothetical protein